MFSNNSKILITGGAGFIGSHVGRALAERGHTVFLMDVREADPGVQWLLEPVRERVHFLKGSITDLPVLLSAIQKQGISKIFHTSAVIDLEVLVHQPCTAQKIMVEGHMNVLEAVRLAGIGRVVFTSSIAVYAPVQYEPIDESHPVLLPQEGPTLASYSSFKLAAESIGLFYWAYHGVDFVALRLSAVYGFGMKYPMYVKPMVENSLCGLNAVFPTGGDMRRDYTYIQDVVSGVIQALDAPEPLPSRIYNISCGAPLHNAFRVAEAVKKLLPEAKIEIGGGLSDLEAKDLRNRGQLSIERAQKELGFTAKFTLEDGIGDYIQQYRNYIDSRG
jgi:nucleoside-diphosphate-sugar epimerase